MPHANALRRPAVGLPPCAARRRCCVVVLALPLWLAACGRDDPQAKLDAAVRGLQAQLEAKKTSGVMDMLDAQFAAQGNLDRDWARRTMTTVFLRFANVRVVALTQKSEVDPTAPQRGHTVAQVLLTGAQGLIPERAEPYNLRLEWRMVGGDWKLQSMAWE